MWRFLCACLQLLSANRRIFQEGTRLHVAIIAMGIPGSKYPLNGIFEWDQAKALAAAGVQVDYLAVDLRSFRRFRPWGITHGQKDGISWHCISIPIGRFPLEVRVKIGVWAFQRLYRNVFADGAGPDIFHAHFDAFGYMAAQLSIREKIPFVVTEHNSDILEPHLSSSFLHILRESHSRALRVIAVSSSLKTSIFKATGVEAVVVPNVVTTEFHYAKKEHEGTTFVTTCVLEYHKRTNVLLRAFASLCRRYNDIALEIVGDGEQRESLVRLAKELCIVDKVTFHGRLPRAEIAEIYNICDCFVLPSAFETFGVVYIEAMAAGLPVIATHCGGPENFVTEENGVLVPVDDVEALAEAMERLIISRRKYDGKAISANTIKLFSPETIAKQLLMIYQEALLGWKQSKRTYTL